MTTLTNFDMFDSIYPQNIPIDAQFVGGYIDGAWNWMATQSSLFPHASKFTFAVFPSHDADCLDVEHGDASPAQTPGWVLRQRARGKDPFVYCSQLGDYGWQAVQNAFNSAGVAHPHYGIASYNGRRILPILNGITATFHQYVDVGPYDRSSLSDTFINLVGGKVSLNQLDANGLAATTWSAQISSTDSLYAYLKTIGYVPDAGGMITVSVPFGQMMLYNFLRLSQLANATSGVLPKLDALAGAEAKTDTDLLAAVSALGSDQKAGFAQLASAVATVQPGIPPTEAQVADIKASFAAALQTDISNITLTIGTK